MLRKTLDVPFEIKEVDDSGAFSGYASVFDVIDSGKDVVKSGAFARSLNRWSESGRMPALLWQHDQERPLGVYTMMQEDEKGLYVEGLLLKDDVQLAREAYALMKARAITGLSIGYKVMNAQDGFNNTRHLMDLELFEVSLVTFPMNDSARIDMVKSSLESGNLPSLRDFEKLLREAGFSKSQATAITNRGLAELIRSESGEDGKKSRGADIQNALSILRSQ